MPGRPRGNPLQSRTISTPMFVMSFVKGFPSSDVIMPGRPRETPSVTCFSDVLTGRPRGYPLSTDTLKQ